MKVDEVGKTNALRQGAELIAKYGRGLPEEVLVKGLRIGTRIRTETVEDDAELPIGASRFGGRPDLPASMEWPSWEGFEDDEPSVLSFLAQLNLEEIPDPSGLLPERGWLYFFFDAIQQPWGFSPGHRRAQRVFFVPNTSPLQRRDPPTELRAAGRFRAARLIPSLAAALPKVPERLGLVLEDDSLLDLYGEIAEERICGNPPHNRFMGWPLPVQSEMEVICQLALNGLDPMTDESEAAKRCEAGAVDWLLLLQVDTERTTGWKWGDSGRLYFWIRKQDLMERFFENSWAILQCY